MRRNVARKQCHRCEQQGRPGKQARVGHSNAKCIDKRNSVVVDCWVLGWARSERVVLNPRLYEWTSRLHLTPDQTSKPKVIQLA